MAKPFTPRLIRINEEALELIPETLRAKLANNMAYAVRPDSDGQTIISDAPDAAGRLCAFIPTDKTENIAKAGAKAPRINARIETADGSSFIMTVAVPENVMDEEIAMIIQNAADCVREDEKNLSTGDGDVLFNAMLDHLNNFTPLAVTAMTTDMDVKLK